MVTSDIADDLFCAKCGTDIVDSDGDKFTFIKGTICCKRCAKLVMRWK
jgi:hypothetical protein